MADSTMMYIHAKAKSTDATVLFVIYCAFAIGSPVYYALHPGQDANWDQRNYHLAIPYLLSHGEFWKSVAPTSVQSYFNPYVLQFQYWFLTHLSAVNASFALAIVQSTSFVIAGAACFFIARRNEVPPIYGFLGATLCLLSPMALSESGGTYVDLITAFPIIAAYVLLLTRDDWLSGRLSGAFAGMFLGIAAALKLTNGVYALGVVGFIFAGQDTLRARAEWFGICVVAAMASFVGVGGPWFLDVWHHLGNPFFPYFNAIFQSHNDIMHSGVYFTGSGKDGRFIPQSVLAIWRWPLYWLIGGSPVAGIGSPSAEVAFTDARWVVVIGGLTVFLGALPWRRQQLRRQKTGLLFAFSISYLAWLFQFGIQRYVLPLEILCGAVLLIFALRVHWGFLAAGVLAAYSFMVVPDWGHIDWGARWSPIGEMRADIDPRSIVFLGGRPSSYTALALPVGIRYVGATGDLDLRATVDTALTRQVRTDLAEGGPVYELDRGNTENVMIGVLASYGLAVSDECQWIHLSGDRLRLCQVDRK